MIVLDRYFDHVCAVTTQMLADETLRGRLSGFTLTSSGSQPLYRGQVAVWMHGWRHGLEDSEHSEAIHLPHCECQRSGRSPLLMPSGELSQLAKCNQTLAGEAGAASLEAWHGAMLRIKVERSPAPLDC